MEKKEGRMIYEPMEEGKIEEIGGKGFLLSGLVKAGFPVPPFFVLSREFFFSFLGEERGRYEALLSEGSPDTRKEILRLIERREFTKEWKDAVLKKAEEKFGKKGLLSVRSSATDEDGEECSFAGMMESFLNVEADEALFPAIKKCYLSCFSERAMLYRARRGLIRRNLGMAVILQKMVSADVSGVIFTSNPKTNDPDEVLISVVTGLGEGLVSGEKDSADVVFDKFGEITERSTSLPLSAEKLRELRDLSLRVEDLYPKKRGRDIEFSVKDGKIYLLQDRLITTYRHIDKRKKRTILDNSNIIESYSGVTTPLTFSFAREVYEKIYRQTLRHFYISKERIEDIAYDLQNMIVFYENKVYYRLNGWYKMTSLYPGYKKNKKYMEHMMGVKVELKETKGQAKVRLLRIYLRFLYKMLRIKKDSRAFVKKFQEVTEPYFNNPLTGYENKALVRVYRELEASILDDFITPITNDMGAMVFLGLLNEKVKKKGIEDYEGLIGGILGKQGNVESVKQSLALMEIVDAVRDDDSLRKEFKEKSIGELKAFLTKESKIGEMLRRYIELYGARAMDELKLETVTLSEDSAFLFQTIKSYLETERTPVYQPAETKEEELYGHFSFAERLILKRLVKITKFFVKNRELLRLRRTYIYSIVRNIFLRLGHNFEEEGILSHFRDIFFLTKEEVFRIAGEGRDAVSEIERKIGERKAAYEENKGKTVYERMYFYGEVKPQNMVPIFTRQEKEEVSGKTLKGTAGGGKAAVGRVKLVEDPKDAEVSGFILMAKRTDPGWTVLFPMAKAIIIERGSVLSHSAVIAREMGIPLVVGVRGLTEKVKDGMLVRADGVKGTVEILEDEDEAAG